MIKISRLFLIILAVIAFSYIIPDLYWKAFDQKLPDPHFAYSCTQKQFFIRKYLNKGNKYWNQQGNEISRKTYESALPMRNFRQLAYDGLMPDSIDGVKINLHDIAKYNAYFNLKPRQLSTTFYGLYPLYESGMGRVKLEWPDEYFRIKNKGIDFINASTNKINVEKSDRFTKELKEFGFQFPAKIISGILKVRKIKDEGCFILDAENHLFNLKMIKGEPQVTIIPIYRDLLIKHIACVEMKSNEICCYLVSADDEIYAVLSDSYELVNLPITGYHSEESKVSVMSNLFNKQITVVNDSVKTCFVLDKQYKLIDQISQRLELRENMPAGRFASVLFPVNLKLGDEKSTYRKFLFRVSNNGWFLLLNLSFALMLILIRWRKRTKDDILDVAIVMLTGLFGFLAVSIFSSRL